MKNLSFFVSAFALCASTSYAAIDCKTLPTCESLGYTDTVVQCPKKSIKCPFDTTKGTCLHEAAVGEIAYFTKDPGKGWLLCDGQTITKAKYPELYAFLGQQFCTTNHGGTCGSDVGRVPDYRGFFLRVALPLKKSLDELKQQYGVSTVPPAILLQNILYGNTLGKSAKIANTDLTSVTNPETPQKEGLPNITGSWNSFYEDQNKGVEQCSGAVACAEYPQGEYNQENEKNSSQGYVRRSFSASKSNPIYGASDGVTPVNYAVYAYIYAGKIVQ